MFQRAMNTYDNDDLVYFNYKFSLITSRNFESGKLDIV
jgi:hypothetical protein